jgi:hypothetical protein
MGRLWNPGFWTSTEYCQESEELERSQPGRLPTRMCSDGEQSVGPTTKLDGTGMFIEVGLSTAAHPAVHRRSVKS